MNLHRHYKNRPYKVHSFAKHSETLEEFVVYEPLYNNNAAKLWIRSRAMFEENVKIDNREVPRFTEVRLKIDTFFKVDAPQKQVLSVLLKDILDEREPNRVYSNLRNHSRIHLLIAFVDNKPVAFKLGYEIDRGCFYSWLGGVLPEYRGLGIAKDLIDAQHTWCMDQGYQKIQTKTQNRWREMLMLNIKSGFEIVGFHSSDEGGPKILLEKKLNTLEPQ